MHVVVITDRRLWAGEELASRVELILRAVPRGSVAIQVREKDLDGGPLLRLAREIVEVARPAGAQVWINERVDVALIAGADGVHLPERGISIADARAVGSRLLVGASRHTTAATKHAGASGFDLVQLGPIWAVPDKAEPIGTTALAIRRSLPASTTLVAVGGVDSPERARAAAAAGADAVAVVRAAWTSRDPDAAIAALVEAVAAGRAERSRVVA